MAYTKYSEQREKHLESKTKSCSLKRKTSEVERMFKESSGIPPEITDKPTEEILNGQLDVPYLLNPSAWAGIWHEVNF